MAVIHLAPLVPSKLELLQSWVPTQPWAAALDTAGLEQLRRLPVQPTLLEWSQSVEESLLRDSDLVIIPVNSQSFSRAKSLNRALTAMEQGCQVLSLNEPLYQPLAEFIYRDVDTLNHDLRAGHGRVGPENISALTSRIEAVADPFANADAFVQATRQPQRQPARRLAVIHGANSPIQLHKFVTGQKGLSIGTPFSNLAWGYQLSFRIFDHRLKLFAPQSIVAKYGLPVIGEGEGASGGTLREIDLGSVNPGSRSVLQPLRGSDPTSTMASYARVMSEIVEVLRRLLPDYLPLLAETANDRPGIEGITA